MKQIICAISSVLLIGSCTKSTTQCSKLLASVQQTDSTFYANQSTANCTAYKSALQAWLDYKECGKADSAKQVEYTNIIKALTCQ